MRIHHLFEGTVAVDTLRQYANDPDMFVTFTDMLKVGINPQTEWDDPIGIYTYPVRETLEGFASGVPLYGAHRPYIHLVRSTGRMLELQAVPERLFEESVEPLTLLLGNADLVEYTMTMFNLSRQPGERIWSATRRLALQIGTQTKRDPKVLWNKIFRTMGYDAVSDRGESIISDNEPAQAVFLGTAALKVVQAIRNDLFSKPRG